MKKFTLPEFIIKCGSIQEASAVLGVPYVTLQRWNKKKTRPQKLVADLLLKAHGVIILHR